MHCQPRLTTWLYLSPLHFLLLAILTIPSIYVLWLSLNQSSYGTGLSWVGFQNYHAVFTDPYFWRASVNTFLVVSCVVLVELLIGLAVAMLFVTGVPFRGVMFACILMPYAISEVVAVLVWKMMMDPNIGAIARTIEEMGLGRVNWSASPTTGLVLVGVINIWTHLPFTFLMIYAGLLAIDGSLYEAAHIDGATRWQRFLRITLPLLVPTLLITLIFRLIFAFRMFSEVWLLTKGGPVRMSEVLAVYLYQHGFRYGDFGIAAATGWLMVIGSLLMASVFLFAMQRGMKGE
ncbi:MULTISPECIES: sugar ABC transporter permease [unclassified Chelatococcus]|uniref:carbohydrate ABC transporter permease n=1 Tax=unclassified Chelatococcus TaxID=2638111 RepID=UPI001BCAE483|nr:MULTISPECIES: sugar ABC transporter permease [unclassified Chelatococcus]CAH1652157.1 Sugar ABC transporter permease [Hyphomicrobiales bacterium]MBS7743070.1 sugar ABC transporter permease [Chelatococcus sp. HY11]MBX3541812.1 sugar ABC transporter permease [Chelatococcus sp.]MCO5074297.1 sugar ABC transporter permease [Chelatococcus sp.]CAH1693684.1 Sugar ABC transporter permease [Hyphomicrobiales bacterium]